MLPWAVSRWQYKLLWSVTKIIWLPDLITSSNRHILCYTGPNPASLSFHDHRRDQMSLSDFAYKLMRFKAENSITRNINCCLLDDRDCGFWATELILDCIKSGYGLTGYQLNKAYIWIRLWIQVHYLYLDTLIGSVDDFWLPKEKKISQESGLVYSHLWGSNAEFQRRQKCMWSGQYSWQKIHKSHTFWTLTS